MNQSYLPQTLPGQQEGPEREMVPVWYQILNATLAPGASVTLAAQDIGTCWRVAIFNADATAGQTLARISQTAAADESAPHLVLGSGGSARFPAVSQFISVQNAGATTIEIVAVMLSNFNDDYNGGVAI